MSGLRKLPGLPGTLPTKKPFVKKEVYSADSFLYAKAFPIDHPIFLDRIKSYSLFQHHFLEWHLSPKLTVPIYGARALTSTFSNTYFPDSATSWIIFSLVWALSTQSGSILVLVLISVHGLTFSFLPLLAMGSVHFVPSQTYIGWLLSHPLQIQTWSEGSSGPLLWWSSNPGEKHVLLLLLPPQRVFRYLQTTIELVLALYTHPVDWHNLPYGLTLPPPPPPANILWWCVDADWANGCPGTYIMMHNIYNDELSRHRSICTYTHTHKQICIYIYILLCFKLEWRVHIRTHCFMVNGGSCCFVAFQNDHLLWLCLRLRQSLFLQVLSSQEVVYFLRNLVSNLGIPQPGATTVFADNKTCIAWSEGSVGGSERQNTLIFGFTLFMTLSKLELSLFKRLIHHLFKCSWYFH